MIAGARLSSLSGASFWQLFAAKFAVLPLLSENVVLHLAVYRFLLSSDGHSFRSISRHCIKREF